MALIVFHAMSPELNLLEQADEPDRSEPWFSTDLYPEWDAETDLMDALDGAEVR